MAVFIDPRADPNSRTTKPSSPPTTTDPEALAELHRLCWGRRLYDVERWIQAGRPLQIADGTRISRRVMSALEIALQTKNQALVLLLLCNGYDPNLEPESPLDLPLRARRWDLLDLLLEWGADPARVSLSDLFGTYRSDLMERFRTLGVNLTAHHELAEALAYHTSNKPLFGFAKRHRERDSRMQIELNIALAHHAREGNEKGVQLCLWAGADPHARAPTLEYMRYSDGEEDEIDEGSSAVYWGCSRGHVRILERLGPHPSRDDFDDLYRGAPNGGAIELLARSALPRDVGAVLSAQAYWLAPPFGEPRSLDVLRRLFEAGVRWQTSSPQEITDVRRALLKTSDYLFEDVLKTLHDGRVLFPSDSQGAGAHSVDACPDEECRVLPAVIR
jgi:hypothetical protein